MIPYRFRNYNENEEFTFYVFPGWGEVYGQKKSKHTWVR